MDSASTVFEAGVLCGIVAVLLGYVVADWLGG